MTEVTTILAAIDHGEPNAAERLLPLVYDELRKLAAQRLAHESRANPRGHRTCPRGLSPVARRRVRSELEQSGTFLLRRRGGDARILVDNARRKRRPKHGGEKKRLPLEAISLPAPTDSTT